VFHRYESRVISQRGSCKKIVRVIVGHGNSSIVCLWKETKKKQVL
jgi:hypothetical protein